MVYQQYLRTEHWRLLRGAKLQIAPMCELCEERNNLEVHHKLYRASWFDTKIMDLQVLCHDCHMLEHAKDWERVETPKPAPLPMKTANRIAALRRAIAKGGGRRAIQKKQRRLDALLRA